MTEGIIIKALSGYYYVAANKQSKILTRCRARGVFRLDGTNPLVGDRVLYTHTEHGEGTVNEVLPRSSELVRPPVANIELAVVVFSLKEPDLNFSLLDKFLVHAESAKLDVAICLTKSDLLHDDQAKSDLEQLEYYRKIGYPLIKTSTKFNEGITELSNLLTNRISVFAGQSGVGKSSLINSLVPGLSLETNEISNKLGRGKHTTRHVELIPLEGGGFVADTPGFSQLDFLHIEADELDFYFKEFVPLAEQCRFRGCTHIHEPGCEVLAATERVDILQSRYDHYSQFYQEMKERKRRY